MGIMDILMQAGGGSLLEQVAKQAGIPPSQAEDLIKSVGSAMTGQIKGRIESPKVDSSALEEMLRESKYANMIEKPDDFLNSPRREQEGIDILKHITGSKEVSREVAKEVAQKSGFDTSLIKSLLPMLAPLVIGALGKGLSADDVPVNMKPSRESDNGLMGMLDFDNDGSIMDDVAGLAMKYIF
jgi:hypothetical protein